MKLTLGKNKFLAIGLLAAQLLSQTSESLDGNAKLATSMTAAAAAAALQVLAHKRNPDGSKTEEPKAKEKREQ